MVWGSEIYSNIGFDFSQKTRKDTEVCLVMVLSQKALRSFKRRVAEDAEFASQFYWLTENAEGNRSINCNVTACSSALWVDCEGSEYREEE
jgi:hypothetical protein